MGATQSAFLAEFTAAFDQHFEHSARWDGGQSSDNCAGFASQYPCRRPGGNRATERFELGDATVIYRGWKVVVEFESKELPLSNILKYWPYLRGELNASPTAPVILCHFSDWWSYATRRDLWEWTISRMRSDPDKLVNINGRQFDHGGADPSLRQASISSALAWIDTVTRAAV